MGNKDTLFNYLSSLEESLRRIREMDFTFDMILGDEDIQDLLDRRMQKAIEACIDIAAHVCAELQLKRAETAAELFTVLQQDNILTKELGSRLSKAVGFRNIIVHEYIELDYKIAYSNLAEKLQDLEEFAHQIKKFIDSRDLKK